MNISSEKDITGAAAKYLREQANLPQKAFWNSVGLTQSAGCHCEQGQSVSRPIRILIFTMYVAGLRIDATTEQGTTSLHRLAQLQASEGADTLEAIGATMLSAKSHLSRALGMLSRIPD